MNTHDAEQSLEARFVLRPSRYDEYLAELKHQDELAREALNPTGIFIL